MERFFTETALFEWNNEQDRGSHFSRAVQELSQQFPPYAELIKAFDERWEETASGPIQPAVDILDSLKQRGYALYALSNWSAETFGCIRHKFPFLEWFETIVLSGEVKLLKRDLRIFQLFLEQSGRTAKECLFIDDSEAKLTAARQLGLQTIRAMSHWVN